MTQRNVTKTLFLEKDDIEGAVQYTERVNEALDGISKEYPSSSTILLPTPAPDGKLTTLIQWNYLEPIDRSNIMITGLANNIIREWQCGADDNVNQKMLVDKIQDFLK